MRPLLSTDSSSDMFSSTAGGTSHHSMSTTISNGTAYFRPASIPDRDSSLPLRLLSIDGGGIHGHATLLQIQDLMLNLFVSQHGRPPRNDEIPKPCDHFDLIGGTGTGGLIALLLGRLRLDIETAKTTYQKVSRESFRCENTLIGLQVKKTLFKATKFETSLRNAVAMSLATPIAPSGGGILSSPSMNSGGGSGSSQTGKRGKPGRDNYQPMFRSVKNPTSVGKLTSSPPPAKRGDPETLLYDPAVDRCRVFVTAVHKGSAQLLLLRTYDAAGSRWKIWEAGRATCATPPMFKALQVEHSIFLGDGGSPVAAVVEEALAREFPGREVGVLVSIGSGGNSEAEKSHLHLLRSGYVDAQNCYRFDPGMDSREWGVNEFERFNEIEERVRKYVAQNDIRVMILDAARKLGGIATMRSGAQERGWRVMVFDEERKKQKSRGRGGEGGGGGGGGGGTGGTSTTSGISDLSPPDSAYGSPGMGGNINNHPNHPYGQYHQQPNHNSRIPPPIDTTHPPPVRTYDDFSPTPTSPPSTVYSTGSHFSNPLGLGTANPLPQQPPPPVPLRRNYSSASSNNQFSIRPPSLGGSFISNFQGQVINNIPGNRSSSFSSASHQYNSSGGDQQQMSYTANLRRQNSVSNQAGSVAACSSSTRGNINNGYQTHERILSDVSDWGRIGGLKLENMGNEQQGRMEKKNGGLLGRGTMGYENFMNGNPWREAPNRGDDDGEISDLEEDEEIMAHLEQLREITRKMYQN